MSSPDQSLLDLKARTTPQEFADFLSSKGKVFWWERGKFWIVTEHRLGEQILKSPDYTADRSSFFISRMPNLELSLIADFFSVISKMMVMSDDPKHGARRKIASLGMTDELMDYFRPVVEKTVRKLIDAAVRKGRLDFVDDIARALPSIVLADLFSIPENEREQFYAWSNNMTQFFGGASQYRNQDGIQVNQSASSIRAYFVELVERRKAEPQDDFLSRLLAHQAQFGLDDGEIISQAIMMLVAGQVTTTDQLGNNMFTLLNHPEALASLQAEPAQLATALEELNRLDPAVTFLFRVVKNATSIGQQPVAAGDVVFISTHAVNRDPAVFDRPNDCVLARKRNPHFAYGHGPHFCLGAKLARIEMAACFGQLLERFPKLRLGDAPCTRKHHSLAFSGFESLPLHY